MAIRNSARAEGGSPFMRATPPKMNKVMPSMGTPWARPTSACASSCARIDPKNSSAASTARLQFSAGGHSGCKDGNQPAPRLKLISQKTTNRLQSTRTSMPARLTRRKPPWATAGSAVSGTSTGSSPTSPCLRAAFHRPACDSLMAPTWFPPRPGPMRPGWRHWCLRRSSHLPDSHASSHLGRPRRAGPGQRPARGPTGPPGHGGHLGQPDV